MVIAETRLSANTSHELSQRCTKIRITSRCLYLLLFSAWDGFILKLCHEKRCENLKGKQGFNLMLVYSEHLTETLTSSVHRGTFQLIIHPVWFSWDRDPDLHIICFSAQWPATMQQYDSVINNSLLWREASQPWGCCYAGTRLLSSKMWVSQQSDLLLTVGSKQSVNLCSI